jgi:hypothetical protein
VVDVDTPALAISLRRRALASAGNMLANHIVLSRARGESSFGFVSDKPMKPMTVDDLAIRSTPRLRGEGINRPPADCEFVEPLMENFRIGGPEQREQEPLGLDDLFTCCGIRSRHGNDAVEHAVCDGVWRAVATEVRVRMHGKPAAETSA